MCSFQTLKDIKKSSNPQLCYMSLVSWNLANKRGGASSEQVSKKQAGGSEKFLMKGMQVVAKLSLKHAMEMRELQAAVLTTVVMNQDDPIVKAATEATQEYHKRQQAGGDTPQGPPHCYEWMGMLEMLVSEDIAEESTQSIRQFCQEYASAEAMATVIHVCRVKKAFQKGKVKVCFAVHASAEQVLKLLVDKLTDKGGEVKRGQAPKGGLERELQTFLDQLTDMLK